MMSGAPETPGSDLNSEINVTPMVDVMLVLLIIFMVAAPMMTVGVPVDLPRASLSALPQDEKPIDIYLTGDGGLYLGDRKLEGEMFVAALSGLPADSRQSRVRLRADRSVAYERVIATMEALSAQGFTQIGLVAEPRQDAGLP